VARVQLSAEAPPITPTLRAFAARLSEHLRAVDEELLALEARTRDGHGWASHTRSTHTRAGQALLAAAMLDEYQR
jgi:hypothetical protein